MKLTKNELKSIIKETIQEHKQLNEIAFSKKSKWNEIVKKYKNDIPNDTRNKFFNNLFNPENKNLTGIGQYIKLFREISKKISPESQIVLINKVLNELPSDDYVLIIINKDEYNKLSTDKKRFSYKAGSDIIYLKGINNDIKLEF